VVAARGVLVGSGMWRNAIRRSGVRPGGTTALAALLLAVLLGAAFLLDVPDHSLGGLEVVIRAGDDSWATALSVEVPDSARRASATPGRVPLVLGVRNAGPRPGAAARLRVHVPARFWLVDRRGEPYPYDVPLGEALARYAFELEPRLLPVDDTVRGLPPLDTLWLEPWLPDWTCQLQAGGVPEFVPAPAQAAGSLARAELFWVLEGAGQGRQAGNLTLHYDTTLVSQRTPARPPLYPTELREPRLPPPQLGLLRGVGARHVLCGDPERPVALTSRMWETASGGRVIEVFTAQGPHKRLFDLDRDSVVEMEMWDPDGDGDFEARRAARFPIPGFLLPRPEVVDSAASAAADSMGWRGPGFPGTRDTAAAATPAAPTTAADTVAADTISPPPPRRQGPVGTPVPPPGTGGTASHTTRTGM